MSLVTYEGVVKDGKIILNEEVILPENAKVYVIVTNEFRIKIDRSKPAQMLSPRLARREDAKKFKMRVTKTKRK